MTMTTNEEIKKGITDFEEWVADITPETIDSGDVTDLGRLGWAADRLAADERGLRQLVSEARANGRSWTEIGHALGVSRQAARQRFSSQVPA